MAFLATRYFLFFGFDEFTSDVPIYHGAANMAHDGWMAYCDFWFPYPPLSLPLIYIPAHFVADYDLYRFLFRAEMIVFDVITAAFLLLFLTRRMNVSRWKAAFALCFYSLLGFSAPHLIYDRLDIVMSAFFLGAIYFYTGEGRVRWGCYVCLLIGALVKLIPVFFVPLFCLFEWFRGDGARWPDRRRAWRPILWVIVPFAVTLIGYNILVCSQLLSQLSQHGARGIQIESNWAVPLIIDRIINGTPTRVDYTFGAFHIVDSDISGWYLWLAKNLGFALLLGYFGVLWRSFRRNLVQSEQISAYGVAVLLYGIILFIVATQRVLSPQYFIWLWPLAAIEFAVFRARFRLLIGAALIFGLTYVVFDIGFFDLLQFDPQISAALVVRNASMTIWAFDTIRRGLQILKDHRRQTLEAVGA